MLPWFTPGQMHPFSVSRDIVGPYGHGANIGYVTARHPPSGEVPNTRAWSQGDTKPIYPSSSLNGCQENSTIGTTTAYRGLSEFDLLNYPDISASTSSLDLLGTLAESTLAEIRVPSTMSLENLQRCGADPLTSTSSLEWFASLGTHGSTGSICMKGGGGEGSGGALDAMTTGSVASGVYFHRGYGNGLSGDVPATTVDIPAASSYGGAACGGSNGSSGGGSKGGGSKVVLHDVNGEVLHPNSFLGPSSRGTAKVVAGASSAEKSIKPLSDSDEYGMKHSLSRELLNVVAAATNYEEMNRVKALANGACYSTGRHSGHHEGRRSDMGKVESRLGGGPRENTSVDNFM